MKSREDGVLKSVEPNVFQGEITSKFSVRDFSFFKGIFGLGVRDFSFLLGIFREFQGVIYPSVFAA